MVLKEIKSYYFWYRYFGEMILGTKKRVIMDCIKPEGFIKFPLAVRSAALFALDLAIEGDSHESEKPLKGFKGTSVRELVLDDRAGTFRVVYTIQVADRIYVLHAFQKKSKKGIKTSKQDIDLIHQRLQRALDDAKSR